MTSSYNPTVILNNVNGLWNIHTYLGRRHLDHTKQIVPSSYMRRSFTVDRLNRRKRPWSDCTDEQDDLNRRITKMLVDVSSLDSVHTIKIAVRN